MDSASNVAMPALAFFAAALLLQYLGGGLLSDQPAVQGIGLLFQLPVLLLNALSFGFPWAAPFGVLAVIALFIAYRQHLGAPLYLVLYGCMIVLVLGA